MIVDSRTRLDEQTLADEGMSPGESAMHTHYASNALAQGHAETCARVTTPRNWPTMLGRPDCTCGHSADANARMLAAQSGTFSS